MNLRALEELAENAAAWAKAYLAIYDALIKNGVPEGQARQDALMAATFAAGQPEQQENPWPED